MSDWTLLLEQPPWFTTLAGLLGLLIGSFINVVAYRLPIMLKRQWHEEAQTVLGLPMVRRARFNLALPGSCCPRCNHALRVWENVPVLSYLALRGRCSACSRPISARYPLVELLSGALSAAVAWRCGPGFEALLLLVLTWGLIALSVIDLQHRLLPDVVVLPMLWLGLLINTVAVLADLTQAVLGVVAGYLSLWTLFWLFKLLTGKDGMGYGDFKLLAMMGAWGGVQIVPFTLLLASIGGALTGLWLLARRKARTGSEMPFGPCLAIAGWIMLLWSDEIHTSYLHMTGF
ncbi:A24 family peptidase [Pseudomonas sp. RP23018S]|uniref:prepilin peptidase n=1 Tax=Pseudomonas sp. RP23018S TaxID=3096037 RepID=UPI002ACA6AB0|nr:A24 family peptidase [Pseudomonas sp. RP23018S]MDZ5603291.1 A24 family peptidase [Pseudomonas sp. RP23018S]